MARFTDISVLTDDVMRLAAFYGTALQARPEGDGSHAEVCVDGVTLAFDSIALMEELAPGATRGSGTGRYLLGFAVPDVDVEYERLVAAGVTVVKPPTTYPWGRRAAWFRDPDGNMLNLYTVTAPDPGRGAMATPKEIVRAYFEGLLNGRDLTVCDRLLAADYVDHDAPADTPPGPASVRAFVGQFLAEYPDLRVHIEDMVAEGDRVAVRAVWHGTHRVTGAPYDRTGIAIFRLNDEGRIAERWSAYDPA